MASFLITQKCDGDLYFLCMFCSTWIGARLHQSRIYLPVGRISRAGGASGKTNRTKAGNSKITHSVIPSHQQCAKNRQCSSGTNERNLIKVVKMKPYFAALMLSSLFFLLMLVRSVLLIKPTYRKQCLQPNDGPVAQATRPATVSTDRKTECFRLYTPDRKPG